MPIQKDTELTRHNWQEAAEKQHSQENKNWFSSKKNLKVPNYN